MVTPGKDFKVCISCFEASGKVQGEFVVLASHIGEFGAIVFLVGELHQGGEASSTGTPAATGLADVECAVFSEIGAEDSRGEALAEGNERSFMAFLGLDAEEGGEGLVTDIHVPFEGTELPAGKIPSRAAGRVGKPSMGDEGNGGLGFVLVFLPMNSGRVWLKALHVDKRGRMPVVAVLPNDMEL